MTPISSFNPSQIPPAATARYDARHAQKPEADSVNVPPPPPSTALPSQSSSETSDARGILRLLESGHFRPVAEIRLRINFADEIAVAQTAATGQAASDHVSSLLDSLSDPLGVLLGAPDLTEAQKSAVAADQQDFNDVIDKLVSGDPIDTSALVANIQQAFDTFHAHLQSSLASTPSTTPDTTSDPAVDPIAPPSSPADEQFQALISAFNNALVALTESLNQPTSILPPLSPPTGHGTAYAKFLAIYQQQSVLPTPALEPDSGATPPTPPLDVQA